MSKLRSLVDRARRARRGRPPAAAPAGSGVAGDDGRYGGAYFGEGRDPLDRAGRSGYERYGRDTSHADPLSYLLWRFVPFERSLDVGCATGFVVEALRELGRDAEGCDLSSWAIEHPTAGAAGHTRQADLMAGLPFADGTFDLVTAFETLEHLPPGAIPAALQELRRVCRGWVVCTIPSLGRNEHGPHGFPQGKAREDRWDEYVAKGPDYDGPIPFDDLMRDVDGEPVEGHLTIASFAWWTRQFAAAGLERCGAVERRWNVVMARFGLSEFLNPYVFRVPGTPTPPAVLHPFAARAALEERWRLRDRRPDGRSLDFLRAALGSDAAALAAADADGDPATDIGATVTG